MNSSQLVKLSSADADSHNVPLHDSRGVTSQSL